MLLKRPPEERRRSPSKEALGLVGEDMMLFGGLWRVIGCSLDCSLYCWIDERLDEQNQDDADEVQSYISEVLPQGAYLWSSHMSCESELLLHASSGLSFACSTTPLDLVLS